MLSTSSIVLIHGLNGQPARTWASASTGFFWPAELRPYLENARVMLFGYNADVSPTLDENRARVLGIARGLLANLANYRRRPQERDRPLIFVGHSLGGLVIKAVSRNLLLACNQTETQQALVEARSVLESKIDEWDRIYNSTGGIIFFGVPNVGSDASRQKRLRLLERVHVINIPPLLEQALRLHSLDTVDLATNFRRLPLCTRRLLYMYSYIEQRTTAALGEVVRALDSTLSSSLIFSRSLMKLLLQLVTIVKQ